MNWNESLSSAGPWLLQTSYQVSLLVLLVLLVQRLFSRWLSPRARYGLWLLVIARLCWPFSVELAAGPWSPLAGQASRSQEQLARPSAPSQPALQLLPIGGPARARTQPTSIEPEPELAGVVPQAEANAPGSRPLALGTLGEAFSTQQPAATNFGSMPEPAEGLAWSAWLLWTWALGSLLALARLAFSEWAFQRRLRDARPVRDAHVLGALDQARVALKLRRKLECVRTEASDSPAVHGLFRQRILLPSYVLESFSGEELRLLFLHELSHVRRRDVELNLILAPLSALFWFHPLVHLALAHLRAAQEALRDWEALGSSASPSPQLYAGALIKLMERTQAEPRPAGGVGFLLNGRFLKERILMITRFSSQRPRAGFLGGLLALPLAWICFTSAAPVASMALPTGQVDDTPQVLGDVRFTPAGATALKQVPVASHQELPAWQAQLQAALQEPISLHFPNGSLDTFVEYLRQVTDLNFVISPEVKGSYGQSVALEVEDTPIAEVLDLVLLSVDADLGYCLAGESVYIGYGDNLPRTYLTHVYNIAELIEAASSEVPEEECLEQLTDLVREGIDPESWDQGTANLRAWGELLVITQTAEAQAEVLQFLNLLLNRGQATAMSISEREAKLKQQLASLQVSVDYQDASLARVAKDLRQRYGLELFIEPECLEDRLSLTLQGVSLHSMLGFLAGASELNLWTQNGRLYLTYGMGSSRIEVYPIEDLVQRPSGLEALGKEERREGLHEMIREIVSWESWEQGGEMWGWDDLLVVRQSDAVHAELRAFLADLRRGLR